MVFDFLASCSSFAMKITGPILVCPEAIVMKTERSVKILLVDALSFSDAYLSHRSRFRDAELEPYTEIQFTQMLLQKDLARSKKPSISKQLRKMY